MSAVAAAELALRTVVPIALLVGAGLVARASGVLRAEDARVLNAYIYWFALPALFLVDLSGMPFDRANARFVLAGALPLLAVTAALALLAVAARLSRGTFVLLAVSTVFGSLAFFGIPFLIFAFPGREAERLATLAAAGISVPAVAATVSLLEFARLEGAGFAAGLREVGSRLLRNPLLIAIAAGTALAAAGVHLPQPIERPLHMLGTTTATVAFFMLGVFLYGRRYVNLAPAAGLALLRLVVLPLVALVAADLLGLTGQQRTTAVLMNGMPAAISMLVLSERYAFHPQTIASLVLLSSVGSAVTLNVWLWVLS